VRRQQHLPWNKRRDLLATGGGIALSRETVAIADNIVKATGIPYHMIVMIPQGRSGKVIPYVYADGWFLKLRTDKRGIWNLHFAYQIDQAAQAVMVTCVITLGTGQTFEGLVYRTLADEQGKDRTANWTRMVNKAITQARGKAAYAAVGGTFPGIAEEYLDLADESEIQSSKQGIKVSMPDVDVSKVLPGTTTALVARARESLGLNMADVLKILGVEKLSQVSDIANAWAALQKAVQSETTAAD